MKSFNQFLKEMPILLKLNKKGHGDIEPFQNGGGVTTEKIGDYNSEHAIHRSQVNGSSSTGYALVHKPTNKVYVKVTGYESNLGGKRNFGVKWVTSHPNSQVKAHEFYHHLITQHGVNINSDTEHSEGGAKVWKKLSEYPDLKVTHHGYDGNEMHMHKGDAWPANYTRDSADHQHFKTYGNSYFKAVKK